MAASRSAKIDGMAYPTQEFLAAWAASKTTAEVAERTGLSPKYVRSKATHLRNRGYDVPRRPAGRERIPDAVREDHFRKQKTRICRKHRETHPTEARARSLFARAVRSGKIKRQPCSECGEPKAHGHHDDYSKPLEVRWLCRKHHVAHHKGTRTAQFAKMRKT